MARITNVNEKYISVEEMRAKLGNLRERGRTFFDSKMINKLGWKTGVFIEESQTFFSLWLNEGSVKFPKCCCYTCRRDDRLDLCPLSSPSRIYGNLRQYNSGFPVLNKGDEGVPVFDVSWGKVAGIMFRNEKYEGKWIEAVSYDMNSAYGWGACQDMPDTRYGVIGRGKVGKDQIGFDRYGDLRYEGEWAEYIYWKCSDEDHPFRRYMNVWYDKKAKASDRVEKKNAKEHIVIAVGYLENKNHILRAAALGHVNRLIRKLTGAEYNYEMGFWSVKDRNFLYGNTDSIVVRKGTKLDVELGEALGQWKVENEGWFAYKGFNCQWKGDKPKIRGVCKFKLSEDDDITQDKVGKGNKYVLWTWNEVKKDLEEVTYFG